MPDHCPLLNKQFGVPFIDNDIPAFCRENCGETWEEAAGGSPLYGYEAYHQDADLEECCKNSALEFSYDAIIAVNKNTRHYVVVDRCASCDIEYGDETYETTCRFVD